MSSHHRSRHHPRHAAGRSHNPAILASAAVAVAGLAAGVWAGAVPRQAAEPPTGSLPAAADAAAAGRSRAGHGTVDSGGAAVPDRPATRSPGTGKSGTIRPAASAKAANPGKTTTPRTVTGHAPAGGSATVHAKPSKPSKPYLFYDSVTPQAIPAGAEVATYATGAHPIPVSAVAGRTKVLWIDTLGTDPSAQALDVEPGCASPSQVPGWISAKLTARPHQLAIIYTTLSEWPQVRADVASLPSSMRSAIRWWIADPTGTPHIVPGSQATQYYWGSSYDISLAEPGF